MKNKKKSWIWIWGLMFLAWIPGLLAAWPGVFVVDNVFQMKWYLEGTISAHHPILHTYLLGGCLKLGKLKKSLKLILGTGISLFLIATVFAGVLSGLFVGYDAELYRLTVRGFHLYAISFLLCGFNIYGSSFFTALNNGMVSAAISFLRTVVFEVAAVLILPLFFGLDGVWCAITVAELASILITIGAFSALRKRYQYL